MASQARRRLYVRRSHVSLMFPPRNGTEAGFFRDLGGGRPTDEVSARTEEREVAEEGHLLVVGRADDEIERALVRSKVVVLAAVSRNEASRAHLLGVGLLRLGVRDGSHVGPERLGEEEAKVAETSDTDDSDVLRRLSGAVLAQRRENGHATAQHWGSEREIKAVRDTNDEVTRSAVEVGVTAVRLRALGDFLAVVLAGVGADLTLLAVLLAVGFAVVAFEARVVLSTDADDVADLDVLDVLADADGLTNDFVADDLVERRRGEGQGSPPRSFPDSRRQARTHLRVVDLAPSSGSSVQVRSADLYGSCRPVRNLRVIPRGKRASDGMRTRGDGKKIRRTHTAVLDLLVGVGA